MDIAHEPVEDADVAVHTDVDVVSRLGVAEVLLEVTHVGDEQILFALEVFVQLLVFVTHVNYYLRAAVYEAVHVKVAV